MNLQQVSINGLRKLSQKTNTSCVSVGDSLQHSDNLCVTFKVVFERPLVELAEAASYQSHSGLLRSWADISI